MKIVITGNKGLIGTSLKKRLEMKGHEIILTCDLRDGEDIIELKNKIIDKKIDILFHLAAQCKIGQAIKSPEICHRADCDGTFSVMEFARKNNIKKVIYFSSSRVLSKEQNIYTAAKLYGENLCKGYYDSYGIKYIIIRPSTVYGPFWDKTRRLMHLFCVAAIKETPLYIYGNPKTKTLDFTYIDDFVDAIILAMNNKWNKEYNISGNESYNIYKLAKEIIKKTNSNSEIIIKNSEVAQPQDVMCDTTAITGIGHSPKIPLNDGVNRCIKFYKDYLNKNRIEGN